VGEATLEDERPVLDLEVTSGLLPNAVEVDLERLRDLSGESYPRVLRHATGVSM
jgi:hypothetical protein